MTTNNRAKDAITAHIKLPQQDMLAPTLGADDVKLPITEAERALFSACFGEIIDRILAE